MVHSPDTSAAADAGGAREESLAVQVTKRAPFEAARLLDPHPNGAVVAVLEEVNPSFAQDILDQFSAQRRQAILAAAPPQFSRQWLRNQQYPEDSVGRLMEAPAAVFSPEMTVGEAIEQLRVLVTKRFITYGYVTDAAGRLLGVLVMRDLLFADDGARLATVMVRDPFSLAPDLSLMEAMKRVLNRHYPAYPVCDAEGCMVGIVRGSTLFEAQAFEISAQAGSMVGVEKEERLATPWPRSLRFRQPWLQLNLLTAFVAGAVVSLFQHTINELVVLAVFLPVLAGQSGNTGCQALAVALRGMTLGDFKHGTEPTLVFKEALLGLLNGILVGLSAAIGMFALATIQGSPVALLLGLVVFLAMVGSCVISGVSGALVPLTLQRLGADPATASSIFLTTATDVVSMGLLLGLATILIL